MFLFFFAHTQTLRYEILTTSCILFQRVELKSIAKMFIFCLSNPFLLAKADWSQDPPSLTPDIDGATMKIFAEKFDCVFLDRTGCVNLAYMMSSSMLKRVINAYIFL